MGEFYISLLLCLFSTDRLEAKTIIHLRLLFLLLLFFFSPDRTQITTNTHPIIKRGRTGTPVCTKPEKKPAQHVRELFSRAHLCNIISLDVVASRI